VVEDHIFNWRYMRIGLNDVGLLSLDVPELDFALGIAHVQLFLGVPTAAEHHVILPHVRDVAQLPELLRVGWVGVDLE
jgi:hypothetical protein